MSDSDTIVEVLPRRLCSEVQLFDLCDLEYCRHKTGNFCDDPVLLSRFEKISDDEPEAPQRYISGEVDEADVDDGDVYDEDDHEFEMEHFDSGEDDGWRDEE